MTTSHKVMKPFSSAEARVRPSGENATAAIWYRPRKYGQRSTGGDVPEPDGPVVARRGQGQSVRSEYDLAHDVFVADRMARGSPVVAVPEPDGPVGTGRGEEGAVGPKGDRPDAIGVPCECSDQAARRGIP